MMISYKEAISYSNIFDAFRLIRYHHYWKEIGFKSTKQIKQTTASKLSKQQQGYYIFLAKECFAGYSNAEDNFNIYRYASSNAWLFHSSEFFWKALTLLSGNYFNITHEASQ